MEIALFANRFSFITKTDSDQYAMDITFWHDGPGLGAHMGGLAAKQHVSPRLSIFAGF